MRVGVRMLWVYSVAVTAAAVWLAVNRGHDPGSDRPGHSRKEPERQDASLSPPGNPQVSPRAFTAGDIAAVVGSTKDAIIHFLNTEKDWPARRKVFIGFAGRDPEAAWDLLLSNAIDPAPGDYFSISSACLARVNPVKVLAECGHLRAGGVGLARTTALANWAMTNPTAMTEYFNSNKVQIDINAAQAIGAAMGREHPVEALNWALGLSTDSLKNAALTEPFAKWASTDLEGASEWLAKNKNLFQSDAAIANLCLTAIEADETSALAWCQSIKDPARRDAMYLDLYRAYVKKDKAAAEAWLSQSASDEVATHIRSAESPDALRYRVNQEVLNDQKGQLLIFVP